MSKQEFTCMSYQSRSNQLSYQDRQVWRYGDHSVFEVIVQLGPVFCYIYNLEWKLKETYNNLEWKLK